MSVHREYTLTLQLISPFMFESVVNSMIGVDSAYLRDEKGNPAIPMAQIKGVLRDALETLAGSTKLITEDEISTLFGQASQTSETEQDRPERGLAIFPDLVAKKPTDRLHTTRIKIDTETGVVAHGSLQVVELAAPFGSSVDFTGKLVIRYRAGLDIKRIEKAFAAAIRLIPSIGAYKSSGFGLVKSAGCSFTDVTRQKHTAQTEQRSQRATCLVTFDRPIVVDANWVADNVFTGSTIVPGAVFKGALAEQLAIAGKDPENDAKLGAALSALRISHAFPIDSNGNELDLPIPMSIVYGKKVAASSGQPRELIFADALSDTTGSAPIWANGSQYETPVADFVEAGKPEIKWAFRALAKTPAFKEALLPRTHISLNEKNNVRLNQDYRQYTAQDQMLYATNMVPTSEHRWQVTVDTSAIKDATLASALMNEIENGLDGIGRTGASASFERMETTSVPKLPADEIVDLVLVTPAVLLDPRHSAGAIADDYKAYFSKAFGAELLSFFATRKMAGRYLAKRRRPYGSTYYPFILTQPGAVFRLKFSGSEARARLENALANGLPCADLDGKPPTWKTCPFLPEVGYGEIRIHNPDKAIPSDGLLMVEGI